ncbi:hypothetical protein D5086_023026 [Populus alba]|uniref:Uncharacterized protein n=1 Tax=Populus alba TaxID=43335 RepID=A0ACC4B8L3_POPAL
MTGKVHEIATSKATISSKWHPKNREEKQEHSANFRSRNCAIGSHRPILFLRIGKQAKTSLFGFKDKSPHSHGLLLELIHSTLGQISEGCGLERCLDYGLPNISIDD